MQKSLKIAAISVFSVLFYLLAGIDNGGLLSEKRGLEKREIPQSGIPQKEKVVSSDSKVFLSFTQRVKAGSGITSYNTQNKALWSGFLRDPGTIEKLFRVSNSRQVLYSKNIMYRLKQTDMLFPFHFFW